MALPLILDDLIRYCQIKRFPMERVADFVDQWQCSDDLNSLEATVIPCPECFMNGVKDSKGLYQMSLDDSKQEYMGCHTCKVKILVTDGDDN